eukprot:c54714_g1_i1.p2 GENE.c54714_g1_i1~~c54714_g1_i1.p2  ORF type:complete len:128 (+),score=21.93 c54714_g1_i1:105-488(+)
MAPCVEALQGSLVRIKVRTVLGFDVRHRIALNKIGSSPKARAVPFAAAFATQHYALNPNARRSFGSNGPASAAPLAPTAPSAQSKHLALDPIVRLSFKSLCPGHVVLLASLNAPQMRIAMRASTVIQ